MYISPPIPGHFAPSVLPPASRPSPAIPALQATRRRSTAATRAATAQKVADRAVAKAQEAACKAQKAAEKPAKKTPA